MNNFCQNKNMTALIIIGHMMTIIKVKKIQNSWKGFTSYLIIVIELGGNHVRLGILVLISITLFIKSLLQNVHCVERLGLLSYSKIHNVYAEIGCWNDCITHISSMNVPNGNLRMHIILPIFSSLYFAMNYFEYLTSITF